MDLDKIDKNLTLCGLLGNPLAHTLSPRMHNAAFSHLGLYYRYIPIEVPEDQLAETLKRLKARQFRGLNITIPYKRKILQYLDSIDEVADKIGAVNTIVNDDGSLKGYNTDIVGALEALKASGVNFNYRSKKFLILGAGGAARAVCLGLAELGFKLVITNRTYETAEKLTNDLKNITQSSVVVIRQNEINDIIDEINIIINCTPVGMLGMDNYLNSTPISKELLRNDMVIFDMVHSPMETKLIVDAKAVGATIIYGYEMLILQGARSFELWTGKIAPLDVMREAVLGELSK